MYNYVNLITDGEDQDTMGATLQFLQEYRNRELRLVLPQELINEYEVLACLKETQHKQVYLLCTKLDNKKYILKYTDSQCKENLEEEYRLHHTLTHTGLVPATSFIKVENESYFIREYVEGITLSELVETTKEGNLTDRELIKISLQICDILQYLHSQKPPIIHRDIKPDNIIITQKGDCKLIDFGISRRYSREQDRDTVVMGTECSAPPEQYGYQQTDARSDIYSIGILLLYMATGSMDMNEIDQLSISPKIKKWIKRCTRFSPEERYHSIRHLKSRIEKYQVRSTPKVVFMSAIIMFLICLLIGILQVLVKGPMELTSTNTLLKSTVGQDQVATVSQTGDKDEVVENKESYQTNWNVPEDSNEIGLQIIQKDYRDAANLKKEEEEQSDLQTLVKSDEPSNEQDNLSSSAGENTDETDSIDPLIQKLPSTQNDIPTEKADENIGNDTIESSNKDGNSLPQHEGNTDIISGEDNYTFTSALIEEAVRQTLNKSDTDRITHDDLNQITELYICGEQIYKKWYEHFVYGKYQYMTNAEYIALNKYNTRGSIVSLEDIGYMKNLHTLALYHQKISDLSPLQNVTNLIYLGLGSNSIRDISALSNLNDLQVLDLSGNLVQNSDLKDISQLTSLEELDLGDTYVTTFDLLKLMNIKRLSLFGNKLSDCDGLDEMKGLEKLIINGVGIGITKSGLDKITNLTNLKELRIMGSQSFDLSQLTNLTKLTYLDLCACEIESLEGLKGLNLNTLYLDITPVKDISAIADFLELHTIGIRDIPCSDYTTLLKLPNLKNISCNREQVQEIKRQLGEVSYTFWVQ